MAAIPGGLETDRGPPLSVPLRHFLVGLACLLAGVVLGSLSVQGDLPGRADLAQLHVLLVGWIAVTIMGAMTQFVPVWSGIALHSRRLANVQLWLVGTGLLAFAFALFTGRFDWLPLGAAIMLVGFWVFVYNVGRTLLRGRPWDVTEAHFAFALGCVLAVTALGATLAVGLTRPILGGTNLTHGSVRMAHATLALYGIVLTTVFGALYQLGTMFTQSELYGVDHWFRRIECYGFPVGVAALTTGRLFDHLALARLGASLVVVAVFAFSLLLARRLYGAQTSWTPMLSRYAVVAASMAGWALWTAPFWIRDPLHPSTLYGAPGAFHLLTFGVVGFVVLGTLYHVIPFIVWVHRYSDRLGLEAVPMIDDLYDDRLARADFLALIVGFGALVLADVVDVSPVVVALGGLSVTVGVVMFCTNVVVLLHRHSPRSLPTILFGSIARDEGDPERPETNRRTPDR